MTVDEFTLEKMKGNDSLKNVSAMVSCLKM